LIEIATFERNTSEEMKLYWPVHACSPRRLVGGGLRSLSVWKAGVDAVGHKQPMNLDTNKFDPGGGASA
jgi:hypothetical protein